MSRLAVAFAARQGVGIIPFVVAGDPDLEATEKVVLALAGAGALAVELGVPFSDPVADGPVIQAAAERALRRGTTVNDVLALAARIRAQSPVPLVLFSYYNPILQLGHDRFAARAAEAGVDAVLTVDLIAEESGALADALRDKGIDTIYLVAPTTSDARLGQIAARASGFIYAVSRTGVTGKGGSPSETARELVARIRTLCDLPVAVGFGVSSPEHVAEVSNYADAAVVGSALVAELGRLAGTGADADALAAAAAAFLRRLAPGSGSVRLPPPPAS